MFYKPRFCCNCGEKIERIDWTPFTSRRFCAFCAIEKKPHDLIPRAIVIIAVIFGLYGFGGSLQTQKIEPTEPQTRSETVSKPRRSLVNELPRKSIEYNASDQSDFKSQKQETGVTSSGQAIANSETVKQLKKYELSSDEPVYFCGALTKKGTPCSRRVKSKVRCWQHSRPSSEESSRKN